MEPTTRRDGVSGTPPGAAARGHYMPRMAQLLEEVGDAVVLLHLHPAAPELLGGVRIGTGGRDLAQLVGEVCGRAVDVGVAPGVVGLDDVDPGREVDQPVRAEVRAVWVEWMRDVRQPAHAVDEVHRLLGWQERREGTRDEKTDHPALQRLLLLPRAPPP